MTLCNINFELFILVISIFISMIVLFIRYDANIAQTRTEIRNAVTDLDPFIQNSNKFKINHLLLSQNYTPRQQSAVILFRYITLLDSETATGGQPLVFSKALNEDSSNPRPKSILDDINTISSVLDSDFTRAGLYVEIDSTSPEEIVAVIHQIQRIFYNHLESSA